MWARGPHCLSPTPTLSLDPQSHLAVQSGGPQLVYFFNNNKLSVYLSVILKSTFFSDPQSHLGVQSEGP